jgi:hypothetical protein
MLVQKLEESDLRNTTRVLRRGLKVTDEALDDLLRGHDPANSRAGRDDLGEGFETDDTAINVHTEE